MGRVVYRRDGAANNKFPFFHYVSMLKPLYWLQNLLLSQCLNSGLLCLTIRRWPKNWTLSVGSVYYKHSWKLDVEGNDFEMHFYFILCYYRSSSPTSLHHFSVGFVIVRHSSSHLEPSLQYTFPQTFELRDSFKYVKTYSLYVKT